jgi:hypothetical protein
MSIQSAAIASHLNIAESIIASIEEWANVLFVRFVKGSPRFVSKKVVPQTAQKTIYCNPESLRGVRIGDRFTLKDSAYKVTQILSENFVWEKNGVEYTEYPGGYCDEKYKVVVSGTRI